MSASPDSPWIRSVSYTSRLDLGPVGEPSLVRVGEGVRHPAAGVEHDVDRGRPGCRHGVELRAPGVESREVAAQLGEQGHGGIGQGEAGGVTGLVEPYRGSEGAAFLGTQRCLGGGERGSQRP